MVQATFELPEDTVAALQALARSRGAEVDEVAREALQEFVAASGMSDDEYQRRWDALLERVRNRIPGDVTPDDIEAEINAATDEVWAERRAARGR
jgi:Tfp pilus assembly protein PilN